MKFMQRFVKPESIDQALVMLEGMGCTVESSVGRDAIVASIEATAKAALSPGQKVISVELPGTGRMLVVMSSELGCLPD